MSETNYPSTVPRNFDMLKNMIYSPPYTLDRDKYKISRVNSNRGDRYGMPHLCSWEKDKNLDAQFIPVGDSCISLLEMEKIENSERRYYKTWRFHNEECLVNWLNEYNPEFRVE